MEKALAALYGTKVILPHLLPAFNRDYYTFAGQLKIGSINFLNEGADENPDPDEIGEASVCLASRNGRKRWNCISNYGYRAAAVIRELGYPDRHTLKRWAKEYEDSKEGYQRRCANAETASWGKRQYGRKPSKRRSERDAFYICLEGRAKLKERHYYVPSHKMTVPGITSSYPNGAACRNTALDSWLRNLLTRHPILSYNELIYNK